MNQPEFPTGQVALSRAVRFAVDLAEQTQSRRNSGAVDDFDARLNSFAALPSMRGLGLFCELVVTLSGVPDRGTGYLVNISQIDRAVRDRVVPMLAQAIAQRETAALAGLLRSSLATLEAALDSATEGGRKVNQLRWNLTPYYWLAMTAAAHDRVLMGQSFEFAAAHRLHVDSLSAEANREVFGKCNNPSGHGHNYRVEVTVEIPVDASGESAFTLQRLERIVDETIISRFDHKHLNLDTAEFRSVNPSVENIARICHGLLMEPLRADGAQLRRVTVWETEKTSSSYPA